MMLLKALLLNFAGGVPLVLLLIAVALALKSPHVRDALREGRVWPAFWPVPASWIVLVALVMALTPQDAPKPDPLLVNGSILSSLALFLIAGTVLIVRTARRVGGPSVTSLPMASVAFGRRWSPTLLGLASSLLPPPLPSAVGFQLSRERPASMRNQRRNAPRPTGRRARLQLADPEQPQLLLVPSGLSITVRPVSADA